MSRTNNGASAHGENSQGFEQDFRRLQEVVQKLSEGNLTLGEALSAFEEGMALADSCGQMLDEAELRVKQVSERAMRAGSASLADIDRAMRSPLPLDEDEVEGDAAAPELISFEIETYESLSFGERDLRSADDRRRTRDDKTPSKTELKVQNSNLKAQDQAPDKGLDPLFDEDD